VGDFFRRERPRVLVMVMLVGTFRYNDGMKTAEIYNATHKRAE
jgi:hypothetical protein